MTLGLDLVMRQTQICTSFRKVKSIGWSTILQQHFVRFPIVKQQIFIQWFLSLVDIFFLPSSLKSHQLPRRIHCHASSYNSDWNHDVSMINTKHICHRLQVTIERFSHNWTEQMIPRLKQPQVSDNQRVMCRLLYTVQIFRVSCWWRSRCRLKRMYYSCCVRGFDGFRRMVLSPARRDVQGSTQVSVMSRSPREPFSARFYVAQTIATWHDSAVKYRQNRVKMVRCEVRRVMLRLLGRVRLNFMPIHADGRVENQGWRNCLARVSTTMMKGWKFHC